MSTRLAMLIALIIALFAVGPSPCLAQTGTGIDNLVGAWQGKIQFTTGAFADTKDLEFMYAFNAGGTMAESSNYDAAPPVPPAYEFGEKLVYESTTRNTTSISPRLCRQPMNSSRVEGGHLMGTGH